MERPTSGSRTIKSMLEAQERQKPRRSPHTPDGFAGHLPEAPHVVSGVHLSTRKNPSVISDHCCRRGIETVIAISFCTAHWPQGLSLPKQKQNVSMGFFNIYRQGNTVRRWAYLACLRRDCIRRVPCLRL